MHSFPMVFPIMLFVFCSVVLSTVFGLSAIGKMLDLWAFSKTISTITALPLSIARFAAVTILAIEGTLVFVLLVPDLVVKGLYGSILLLLIFTGVLIFLLYTNNNIDCNCFGKSQHSVSYLDIGRNVVLMLISLVGILAYHTSNPSNAPAINVLDYLIICSLAGLAALTITQIHKVIHYLDLA